MNCANASRGQALYLLLSTPFESIYGPEERATIDQRLGATTAFISPEVYHASARVWEQVEFLFSGWGMVPMDENFFKSFPRLRAVFYGAGSVKSFVTEAFWQRDIALTSAVAMNAIPVAEFTLAQILYALKRGWPQVLALRKNRRFERLSVPGGYRSIVGLISLGEIGLRVAEKLRNFDLKVVAYDPFFSPQTAATLGVELVSLDVLFARSDVVSCHAPLLPDTERMLRACHFAAMKNDSTFINTARGEVIDQDEMIAVLRQRPDLWAILDVTAPEPPPDDSPLYTLENVVLTPHIAGSHGAETLRMGNFMVQEFDRFLRGEDLLGRITRDRADRLA